MYYRTHTQLLYNYKELFKLNINRYIINKCKLDTKIKEVQLKEDTTCHK